MTVTFTSINYAGPTTEVNWAKAAAALGSTYGVKGPSDWEVTKDPTGTRQVKITHGDGHGQGVVDHTDLDDTLVLDTISAGTRWDLVCAKRDWQTGAKVTTFGKRTGTASREIPTGRLTTPGVADEQPLALVQLSYGQSVPTAVIDLRCWANNGGLVIADVMALDYLGDVGTQAQLGSVTYIRGQDSAGNPVWVKHDWTKTTLYGVGGALVGNPAGVTEFLKQEGYFLGQSNVSGDYFVPFPRAFPTGLLKVNLQVFASQGVFAPGDYTFVSYGPGTTNGGGLPKLNGVWVRIFDAAGAPVIGAWFGFSFDATGW